MWCERWCTTRCYFTLTLLSLYSQFTLTLYEDCEYGVDDGVKHAVTLLPLYSHLQEDEFAIRGVDDGVQLALTLLALYSHFTPTLLSLDRRMVNLPYVVWTMAYNTLLLALFLVAEVHMRVK